MPVPTHLRFVFRGIFTNTPEEWSFSCKFSRDNPAGQDAGIGDINQGAVTTAIDTFMGSTASYISSQAKCMDWRAYVIGTDGLMEGNPLLVDVSALAVSGGTAAKYPPQIAHVVTTVGADRGPARYGRFYLPTSANIGTDGRVTAAQALQIAEASSTFLKDVSNAVDLEVGQSSEGLNISAVGAAGARQTIDHLEVGRVLDTLRNRRKSMLEERVSTGHIDW